MANFQKPAENIKCSELDVDHDLKKAEEIFGRRITSSDDLSPEESSNVEILRWKTTSRHREDSADEAKKRAEDKRLEKQDYENLSESRNIMHDGLLKILKDIEESNTEGSYMCATIKTKYDLAEHVKNHLKNLIEINN